MATLLSSPLGPTSNFDLFQQPHSPKSYAQDDLPADFDKSFGSSMSISDSFDGHTSQPFPALTLQPQPFLFSTTLGLAHSLTSANQQRSIFQNASTQDPSNHPVPCRLSPRHAHTLGAAMGTTLNAPSPGLAAKMSSPKDMDISPAPIPSLTHIRPSPSETLPKLMDNIHVGIPASTASINDRLRPVLGGSSRPRPAAAFERKSSLQLAHTMSSRLFGAEIALNSHRIFARDQQLLSSPDKEPPPKRRPNSLPTRQSEANERISQLSNALHSFVPPRTRPALSATFDKREASLDAASSSSSSSSSSPSSSRSNSSFAVHNRVSDSGLPLGKRITKRSSRPGSAESFFEDVQDELGALGTFLKQDCKSSDTVWQRQHSLADESQPDDGDGQDINPSPSPSMNSVSGAMAGYFFDPLSPEKLGSRLGMAPVDGPSLLAAMSSTAASPSDSSPPASSPCTRMPPPKRTTSLGTRTIQRATTMAAVPRAVSAAASSSSSSSSFSSGVDGLRTTLGKRANPYVKRPSLTNDHPAIKSAYPVLGVSGQSSRVTRPTAPAPRRCFSAFDHSSLLGRASSSKLNSTVELSPVSPDRRRTVLSSCSEVSDANGSPIAPAMRTRNTRPNYLRRGSKDDSSPLAYGTGLKRSGSRGSDAMVDDLALNNSSYTGSPASAESLPGFGASEKEGKILPCFNVKEDGLMRITSATMTDLLAGKYTNAILSYQVIDCRFGYEYEGGHIPGAINLSTVDKVVGHFLSPDQGRHATQPLPARSQSGKADKFGDRRKHVLVFHCEFSCKRAPTMALALRQADRGLAHDYPNCHFPEIYILQGGYCNFFSSYSNLCEPQQYICMDDPRFLAKRSTELNGFRKQFSRHRSFTYGEGKRHQSLSQGGSRPPNRQSIKEEEDHSIMEESPCPGQTRPAPSELSSNDVAIIEAQGGMGDTSFGSVGDSSFEDGIGDSPCAAAGNRKPAMILQPKMMASLGRRPLLRAGTTGDILPRYMG
ncbi:related to M-phase inducer phosphatase [Melanopsichium pennsylvanicum]|uniref:M-phase inducer phosphatase n=2 Tax=Melanopsichium pennsylvanicum TaxID=63383 RepID=A0AAJ4XGA4_9BASI|nr:related to M-phase inducer phosphatase [Melanopsichium pennsylvanicum 4]SNX81588.1 related to M-phase inducer phosphatase [Melanopsichium pennsylvanicum]